MRVHHALSYHLIKVPWVEVFWQDITSELPFCVWGKEGKLQGLCIRYEFMYVVVYVQEILHIFI